MSNDGWVYRYRTKRPVDLSEEFADEINSDFGGDIWAWVKNEVQGARSVLKSERIGSIIVGDWVPLTVTIRGYFTVIVGRKDVFVNSTSSVYNDFKAVVSDIDTHCGENGIPHYIDFITDNVVPHVPWSFKDVSTSYQQENEDEAYQIKMFESKHIWPNSFLYWYLNDVVYDGLPENLKKVIIEKMCVMDERIVYDETEEKIKNKKMYSWGSAGKLWVPNAKETFGYTTQFNEYGVQYKTLDTEEKRRKYSANCHRDFCDWSRWYTMTAVEAKDHDFVTYSDEWGKEQTCVTGGAAKGYYSKNASSVFCAAPICFRIG